MAGVCTTSAALQDREIDLSSSDTMERAVVTSATFTYCTTQGTALLAPGAALFGNASHCFECGHEHGVGARCLSFHFTPEFVESVVSGVPGVRRMDFALPSLPPIPELIPVEVAGEVARQGDSEVSFEELALDIVATVAGVLAEVKSSVQSDPHGIRMQRRLQRVDHRAQESNILGFVAIVRIVEVIPVGDSGDHARSRASLQPGSADRLHQ
jgi:hypothetical protein